MGWKRTLYGLVHGDAIRAMEAGFDEPQAAQEAFLRSLLSRNAESEFGRRHGFSPFSTVDEFRRRAPLASYEDLRPDIERLARGEKQVLTEEDPLFFALTSGTTGPEKLIPMTPSLEGDMARAQVYWNARLIGEDEALGRFKFLVLISSPEERTTPAGIPCRSVSSRILVGGAGHVFRFKPFYRAAVAVPGEVFKIGDGRARLYLAAFLSLTSRLGSITAANPSTIVHFCRFLHENRSDLAADIRRGAIRPDVWESLTAAEQARTAPLFSGAKPRPQRADEAEALLSDDPFSLRALWPGLELVNCWLGGTLSLYLRRLRQFSGDIPLRDVGFRASEGFFALPLQNETPAGALHVTGNFFEFEEEPSSGKGPLLLQDLEPGGRYKLFVTQAGGLYRYDMEDIVEVTGFYKKTPLVRFLHKSGDVLSLTGEKLTGLHAVNAVSRLQREAGLQRLDFFLTHSLDVPPSYLFLLETGAEESPRLLAIPSPARYLDSALGDENCEYRSKRDSGRLAPARAALLGPGTLEAFRAGKSRLRPFDAQYKPLHLLGEGEDREWLLALIAGYLDEERP